MEKLVVALAGLAALVFASSSGFTADRSDPPPANAETQSQSPSEPSTTSKIKAEALKLLDAFRRGDAPPKPVSGTDGQGKADTAKQPDASTVKNSATPAANTSGQNKADSGKQPDAATQTGTAASPAIIGAQNKGDAGKKPEDAKKIEPVTPANNSAQNKAETGKKPDDAKKTNGQAPVAAVQTVKPVVPAQGATPVQQNKPAIAEDAKKDASGKKPENKAVGTDRAGSGSAAVAGKPEGTHPSITAKTTHKRTAHAKHHRKRYAKRSHRRRHYARHYARHHVRHRYAHRHAAGCRYARHLKYRHAKKPMTKHLSKKTAKSSPGAVQLKKDNKPLDNKPAVPAQNTK